MNEKNIEDILLFEDYLETCDTQMYFINQNNPIILL